MDYGKLQYFEKVEKPDQREFVNAHNNCILCGTVLELRHSVEQETEQIKEEAHCPHCDMRTRAKKYTLN